MEKKRDMIVGVLGLAFIAIAGVGSYFAFVRDEKQNDRLASEVPANITNIYARHGVDPTTGAQSIEDITVTYKYVIDGKSYERSERLSSSARRLYKEGQPAKVCYDTRNIEEAKLFPAAHRCGT